MGMSTFRRMNFLQAPPPSPARLISKMVPILEAISLRFASD